MAKGRKKPLIGGQKYDRAIFTCSTKDCDEEFYVSLASTPSKRYCAEHFAANYRKDRQALIIKAYLATLK
jgi:hypothetical protein